MHIWRGRSLQFCFGVPQACEIVSCAKVFNSMQRFLRTSLYVEASASPALKVGYAFQSKEDIQNYEDRFKKPMERGNAGRIEYL